MMTARQRPPASGLVTFLFAVLPVAAMAQGIEGSQVLSVGQAEIGSVQTGSAPAHCTGTLLAPDVVLTALDCIDDAEEEARLSYMPGMNIAAGPQAATPHPREFAVARLEGADAGIGLFQIGRIEGRDLPPSIGWPEAESQAQAGDLVDVIHYAGADGAAQVRTQCVLTGYGLDTGSLSCSLPDAAKGAPVLYDGQVIGAVTEPRDVDGAAFGRLPDADFTPERRDLETIAPFGSVNVLNLCDQDVHQGLFWLDADGKTWMDLARRVPAGARMFLPVETVGDAIFIYGRSDDGTREWRGDDITVRIKGVDLPMRKLDMPRPTGDLTIVYDCE